MTYTFEFTVITLGIIVTNSFKSSQLEHCILKRYNQILGPYVLHLTLLYCMTYKERKERVNK